MSDMWFSIDVKNRCCDEIFLHCFFSVKLTCLLSKSFVLTSFLKRISQFVKIDKIHVGFVYKQKQWYQKSYKNSQKIIKNHHKSPSGVKCYFPSILNCTLIEIFIFCPKFNFVFPRKLSIFLG